jgi:hypothetical protein
MLRYQVISRKQIRTNVRGEVGENEFLFAGGGNVN